MGSWAYGHMGIWHIGLWLYGHMGIRSIVSGIWAYGQTELGTNTRGQIGWRINTLGSVVGMIHCIYVYVYNLIAFGKVRRIYTYIYTSTNLIAFGKDSPRALER